LNDKYRCSTDPSSKLLLKISTCSPNHSTALKKQPLLEFTVLGSYRHKCGNGWEDEMRTCCHRLVQCASKSPQVDLSHRFRHFGLDRKFFDGLKRILRSPGDVTFPWRGAVSQHMLCEVQIHTGMAHFGCFLFSDQSQVPRCIFCKPWFLLDYSATTKPWSLLSFLCDFPNANNPESSTFKPVKVTACLVFIFVANQK
jgi:hypothetical protein